MGNTGLKLGTLVLAVGVTSFAACSTEAPEVDTAPVTEAAAPAAEAAPSALGDAEIAHVAVTANTIDAELAELAETRAESEEVKAFAETMITDHMAVNEQAGALAARLGVTPAPNAVSESLQAGADEARASLEGLSGAAFDRAYIDREVAYHAAVLDALDQTLIPGATNAELRSLLEGVRPAIAAHLDRAEGIQSSLTARR